jgi:hypothetical protein
LVTARSDTADFVATPRRLNAAPHVAVRSSRIDHPHPATWRGNGHASGSSQQIEEVFAWNQNHRRQAKTSFRGTGRVGWSLTLAAAAYNLIRLPKLLGALP